MKRISSPISTPQMELILELSRKFALTSDLEHLLPEICDGARRLLSAERCSLFLHDAAAKQLWTKVATGSGEIRVPENAGIVGHVLTTHEKLNTPDAYAEPRFNPEVDRRTGFVTRNLLTMPVPDLQGKAVAVLQIINKAGGPFSTVDEMLAGLLSDQAGVAIQRYHLQQQAVQAAGLHRELDLARKVQEALIPKHPPTIPPLRSAGWTQAASQTGGDCYDLWALPDGRLGILVADASGHGIGPALVVSQARSLVRVLAGEGNAPGRVLSIVNDRLCADLEGGMFVTAFLAFVSVTGQIAWSCAGHAPVLITRADGKTIDELIPGGMPLGIMEGYPGETATDQLAPGDRLVVCTDGIVEAYSPGEQLFDRERLDPLLTAAAASPDEVIDRIRTAVIGWQEGKEPKDDQTIVLIDVGP